MLSGLNIAPTVMRSQLATDFSEHAIAADLSAGGWTKRASSGSLAAVLEAAASAISGKRVKVSQATLGVRAVTWDLIPAGTTDLELLSILTWGSAGANGGSGMIARATTTAQDAYNAVQHGTNTTTHGVFEAAEIVGSSYSAHAQGSTVPTAGTRYYVRLQLSGTTIRAKVWAVGTDEPGTWESSFTDASQASGNAGLMMVDTTPDWYCEFLSAAIGAGKTAPFPNG